MADIIAMAEAGIGVVDPCTDHKSLSASIYRDANTSGRSVLAALRFDFDDAGSRRVRGGLELAARGAAAQRIRARARSFDDAAFTRFHDSEEHPDWPAPRCEVPPC